MSDTAVIDVEAVQRFLAENPDELRRLLGDAESGIQDRYGRTINLLDKVITTSGEEGMIIRLDRNSKRVLIELPGDRQVLRMGHRVEVKRGRPRKDSLRSAV